MDPDISEFSFGYALTQEIVTLTNARGLGCPLFPSLRAEGELGYNVSIPRWGVPLFLQFKLSHSMQRPNATAEAPSTQYPR